MGQREPAFLDGAQSCENSSSPLTPPSNQSPAPLENNTVTYDAFVTSIIVELRTAARERDRRSPPNPHALTRRTFNLIERIDGCVLTRMVASASLSICRVPL